MDRDRKKEVKYQIFLATCPETGLPYTLSERNKLGIKINFTIPELVEIIKSHCERDPIVNLWLDFIKEIWKLESSSSC